MLGCDGRVESCADAARLDASLDATDARAVAPDESPDVATDPERCPDPTTLAASPMRRLGTREYAAAVADLLDDPFDVVAAVRFPTDPRVNGFDDNAAVADTSSSMLDLFATANALLVERLSADPARRARVVGCDPSGAGRSACIDAFVAHVGRRVARRPLTPSQAARWAALAHTLDGDADPFAGPLRALEGMLLAPSFLYRAETGRPIAGCDAVRQLDGWEVATRLSFLLRATTPDDALLDAAASGSLDTADGVEAAARAMLADGGSRDAVWRFFSQWLEIDELALRSGGAGDADWSDAVRDAMVSQFRRVVEGIVWSPGRDLLDLVDTRRSYVNDILAEHYGLVPVPPPNTWIAFDWPPSSERAGILTEGAVLTATGSVVSSRLAGNAIRRGRWVREILLCEGIPLPPPGVEVNPASFTGSQRERLAAHSTDPRCASCHRRLDPVGFGMERFDDLGRHQTMDPSGVPLTGDGVLEGFDAPEFHGTLELAARLRAAPQVAPCVALQWFRWAYGRSETPGDARPTAALADAFERSHHSFTELVVASVRADAFRYRPTANATETP